MKSIEKINNELFLVIEVDLKSVSTENKFFKLMNEIFGFPSYYRRSLDSLDDFIRDLGWFVEHNIIIKFKNLSRIQDKNAALLLLIKDSIDLYQKHWKHFKDKNVRIDRG